MLTNESISDFSTKKAEYVENDGYLVASKEDKHKIKNPVAFGGPLGMFGGSELSN